MLTKDQVYLFLFNWLKTESGLVVIKSPQTGQTAPRPPRPYASLRFLNPSDKLGVSIDQQSLSVTVNEDTSRTYRIAAEGMRKSIASINIFGENAIDTLARVRDSLDRPDVAESFEAAGITHLDTGTINDLTELLETVYEERGQMDLAVAFVGGSEVIVGTIDEVRFSGTIDGRSVPTITVNDS